MKKIVFILALLLLFAAIVHGTHHKHHDGNHRYHDDNSDYLEFCTNIARLKPDDAKSQLTTVLKRLQDDGLLPTNNYNQKAEKICKNPENYSGRVCSYFRKYEMINNILLDYNLISDTGIITSSIYLIMWCKHPECPLFNAQQCKKVTTIYEGLPGYIDCTSSVEVRALSPETSNELRKEVDKICHVNKFHGPFCLVEKEIGIVDRCSKQDEMKSFLNAKQFNRAILLNYAAMKAVDPENFAQYIPSNEKEQELYSDNLQLIFSLFNEAKYAELAQYMELLPDPVDIVPRCTSMVTASLEGSKQRECILGRVIDQVKQFLQSLPENKPNLGRKKRKMLNTKIDYKEYLQQIQIETILGIVQNQELTIFTITDKLKKQFTKAVGERFQEVKTYFRQVEGFNQEIAKADIGYISVTLNNYETVIRPLVAEVDSGLSYLLKSAIGTSSLDLIRKIGELTLQIAEACNPLKTIFGGGAVTDVFIAAAELAKAIAQVAKTTTLVSSFRELVNKTELISNKFNANSKFLKTVKDVLNKIESEQTSDSSFEENKLLFIQKYNAYSPGVTKPELTEMATYWETLLDEACSVIDSAETAAGIAIKAIVDGRGFCWKIKIKTQKMIETYCEIYDFQFDLMDALAVYVRSTTAVNAASNMNADYDQIARSNPDEILFLLQQLAGLSYIMNQMQRIQTMEAYCDVLEYKEGGVRPSVCQGTSTDINSLISHVGSGCSSKTVQYRNVPTQPAHSGDRAFLNITELFAGRAVTFKIPDGKWLVDNGWINDDEMDAAIYLRKLEVYLPTESQSSREIQVVTKVTGGNTLTEKSTEYLITPPRPLIYDYAEGRETVCRQAIITNPYLLCSTDAPGKICPHTPETDCVDIPTTVLHGSVYAQWNVRLSGYHSMLAIPDPSTHVSVKVGVQLCKMNTFVKDKPVPYKKKHGSVKKHWPKMLIKNTNTRRCCGDGQYWNEKQSSCQPCPDESVRRLHGYYCDNNNKTLSF